MSKLSGEVLTLPKMSGSVLMPKSLNGNVGAKTINIGEDGATFIPSVSADGVISWTNDKELPNPDPVNIKGVKGDKGERGEIGPQGIQGVQGERGEQGLKGDKGDRGEQGPQGEQGEKGDKGDKGDTGATGANGKDGKDGAVGPQGPKGDKGDTGAAGTNGKDGSDGADGKDGSRGTGILKVTTAPSGYTTAIGDYTPKYRIALSTVKSQAKVNEVLIGDVIQYSYYQYQVDHLEGSYAYISATRTSLRGAAGSDATVTTESIKTALGYTPADQKNVETLSKEIDDQQRTLKNTNDTVGGIDNRVKALEDMQVVELETVTSVDEMTDTTKQYILESTGTVWSYGETEIDDTDRNLFDADAVALNKNPDGTTRNGAFSTDFIPVNFAYSDPYVLKATIDGGNLALGNGSNPKVYKIAYYDSNKTQLSLPYSQDVRNTAIDGGYAYDLGYKTDGTKLVSTMAYVKLLINIQSSAITASSVPKVVITTAEPKTIIDAGWYDTGVSSEDAKTGLVDVVLQVEKNKNNIESNIQRLGAIENTLADMDISILPEYWQTAIDNLEETVETLQNNAGRDAVQFLWCSDIHGTSGYVNSNGAGTSATTHIGQIGRYTMDKFKLPFFAITGDIMSQSSRTTEDAVWNEYDGVNQILAPIKEDELLMMKGNHDGAWGSAVDGVYYLKNIGTKKLYNAIYRKQAKDRTRVFGADGTYFFMDDTQGIRHIFLNSHTDGNGSNDSNGHAVYNPMKNFVYGKEQLEWLIDVLSNANGKDIVVYGHPLISQSADGTLLAGILNAYNNKTSYSNSLTVSAEYWGTDAEYTNISVNANFANVTGEVIAYFHGHNHKDNIDATSYTFPSIGITTAGGDVRDSNPVERVVGTATETALDIVTIDKLNRKIYMTRIGAGADRECSY